VPQPTLTQGLHVFMVTRVYNPVFTQRPAGGKAHASVAAHSNATQGDIAPHTAAEQPQTVTTATKTSRNQNPTEDAATNRPRPDLATLKDQAEGRRIQLASVLADFKQTLDALSVPDPVVQQLTPYIHVVQHQGQQPKPNVSLIKASLSSASHTLDAFIAEATQNPSTVVHEWMQSLLTQDIDYTSALKPLPPLPSYGTQPAASSSAQAARANTGMAQTLAAPPSDKHAIQQWVLAAKGLPATQALPLLRQALERVPADQPQWAYRLHHKLAHGYWQTGDPNLAITHLTQAIPLAPNNPKALQDHILLGHWFSQTQQPQAVIDTLAPVLTQATPQTLGPTAAARGWLDYGLALLNQQQPQQAVPALKQAVKLAQSQQQQGWVLTALPALAQAHLQLNQPLLALPVLQKYQQLRGMA
jgi:Tfp pilus assembly protein PilF